MQIHSLDIHWLDKLQAMHRHLCLFHPEMVKGKKVQVYSPVSGTNCHLPDFTTCHQNLGLSKELEVP